MVRKKKIKLHDLNESFNNKSSIMRPIIEKNCLVRNETNHKCNDKL